MCVCTRAFRVVALSWLVGAVGAPGESTVFGFHPFAWAPQLRRRCSRKRPLRRYLPTLNNFSTCVTRAGRTTCRLDAGSKPSDVRQLHDFISCMKQSINNLHGKESSLPEADTIVGGARALIISVANILGVAMAHPLHSSWQNRWSKSSCATCSNGSCASPPPFFFHRLH